MLHDMGPAETFLIAGDSLLQEALRGRTSAGVPLSIIAVSEKLLADLRAAGSQVQFTIVFFDCFRQAWAAYHPYVPTARAILMAHLQEAGLQVLVFSDIGDGTTEGATGGSGGGGGSSSNSSSSSSSQAATRGLTTALSFPAYLVETRPTFLLVSDAFITDQLACEHPQAVDPARRGVHALTLALVLQALQSGIDTTYMVGVFVVGLCGLLCSILQTPCSVDDV